MIRWLQPWLLWPEFLKAETVVEGTLEEMLEDRGGGEDTFEDRGMCQLTVNYVLLCGEAAKH